MSNGPITKSSPGASSGRAVAGVVLLAQAALRAVFLASFLKTLSRFPRLSHVIFGNVYALTMSVALPAAFVVAGAAAGLMLLTRLRIAPAVARAFCVLGLLLTAVGGLQIVYAYIHALHRPPTPTLALMAFNAAVYLGTLIALARSA